MISKFLLHFIVSLLLHMYKGTLCLSDIAYHGILKANPIDFNVLHFLHLCSYSVLGRMLAKERMNAGSN